MTDDKPTYRYQSDELLGTRNVELRLAGGVITGDTADIQSITAAVEIGNTGLVFLYEARDNCGRRGQTGESALPGCLLVPRSLIIEEGFTISAFDRFEEREIGARYQQIHPAKSGVGTDGDFKWRLSLHTVETGSWKRTRGFGEICGELKGNIGETSVFLGYSKGSVLVGEFISTERTLICVDSLLGRR